MAAVLGAPANDHGQGHGVMRRFFLTNTDEPPPSRCPSTDDLAALNYLYPSCAGERCECILVRESRVVIVRGY